MNMKRINLLISEDLHKRVIQSKKLKGFNLSEFIRNAVEKEMDIIDNEIKHRIKYLKAIGYKIKKIN